MALLSWSCCAATFHASRTYKRSCSNLVVIVQAVAPLRNGSPVSCQWSTRCAKLAKILYSFLILPSVFLGRKILRKMQRNWTNLQKGLCVLILLTEEGNNYVICISDGITNKYSILMDTAKNDEFRRFIEDPSLLGCYAWWNDHNSQYLRTSDLHSFLLIFWAI